jgi:hypothetical protein
MYTEACSCNLFCCQKAINITYYECVFVALDLSMQCAYAICELWPVQLYKIFPNYFINGTILLKKVTEHKMCVLIFSTTFEWNISHSKNNWARYHKSISVSCKVPIILVIFQWNYFFDRFSKNTQIQNLLKLSPVGAWLFRVDGQTFDISNSCLFVILRTHPVTCYYNKLQCYLWFLRLLIFSLLLLLKVMELNKHVTLKMNSEVCNSFIVQLNDVHQGSIELCIYLCIQNEYCMVFLLWHVLHPWSPSVKGLWNKIKFIPSHLLQLQGMNPFTCPPPLVLPFFGRWSVLRVGTCLLSYKSDCEAATSELPDLNIWQYGRSGMPKTQKTK